MRQGSRPGVRPLPQTTSNEALSALLGWIWGILVMAFVGTMIALPFVIGGLAVFVPYVAWLREWTENVSLYDLLTGIGWYYAVFMAVIGSMFFVLGKDTSTIAISILGVLILVALLIGKFI